jgi:hypothetical protein
VTDLSATWTTLVILEGEVDTGWCAWGRVRRDFAAATVERVYSWPIESGMMADSFCPKVRLAARGSSSPDPLCDRAEMGG